MNQRCPGDRSRQALPRAWPERLSGSPFLASASAKDALRSGRKPRPHPHRARRRLAAYSKARRTRAGFLVPPRLLEKAPKPIHKAILCSCATLKQRLGQGRGAAGVARDDLEHGAESSGHMSRSPDGFKFAIRAAVASAISRARSNLAERPPDDRRIDHRGNADVLAEAEGEIAIALGSKITPPCSRCVRASIQNFR